MRRYAALMLSLLLIVSASTGCGRPAALSQNSAASTAAANSGSATEATAQPAPAGNTSSYPIGFLPAEGRPEGPFTQEDAEPWTSRSWMSDYGGLLFEWINGYIVAFYCDGDNVKLPENRYDQNVITSVDGRTYKGDLVYGGRFGEFAFTLNEAGDAFEGTWKYGDQQTDTPWNGQATGAGPG